MKVIKNDNGICKATIPSSAIAEEAVDQLQASEKLIAGILLYIATVTSMNFFLSRIRSV